MPFSRARRERCALLAKRVSTERKAATMITDKIMTLKTTSESRRLKPARFATGRGRGWNEGLGKEI
jgi:hypothetical protein